MGVIMGTAAYMSPEQARGRPVDKRADIWSFGAVLFEMLTGRRPFEGRDVSETLGAVLRLDPDWDALPGNTPPRMSTLIRRCLEKEPKQRVHDVADVRLAMEGGFETAASASPPIGSQLTGWRQALPLALGISAVAVVITGLAVWTLKPSPQSPVDLMRFAIATSETDALRISPNTRDLAFSPDGEGRLPRTRSRWERESALPSPLGPNRRSPFAGH